MKWFGFPGEKLLELLLGGGYHSRLGLKRLREAIGKGGLTLGQIGVNEEDVRRFQETKPVKR